MIRETRLSAGWRERGLIVLADCSCVLSVAALTGLCLELVWPGFVSARIDLTALTVASVILMVSVYPLLVKNGSTEHVRTAYVFVFLIADALILARFVSLQFDSILLALAVPFILFFSLILAIRSIHDRRSHH